MGQGGGERKEGEGEDEREIKEMKGRVSEHRGGGERGERAYKIILSCLIKV